MRWGEACKKAEGALTHIVAFEAAWTWCGRKTDPMRESAGHPTCFACIARGAEWRKEWPTL